MAGANVTDRCEALVLGVTGQLRQKIFDSRQTFEHFAMQGVDFGLDLGI